MQTRSYYGADGKLRAQQGYSEQGGMFFTGERRGYFSEYRYAALGRLRDSADLSSVRRVAQLRGEYTEA